MGQVQRGVPMQHYAIQFVSDFFPGTPVSSTNKTDRHDATEILIIVESGVKHHKPTLNQSVKTNGA